MSTKSTIISTSTFHLYEDMQEYEVWLFDRYPNWFGDATGIGIELSSELIDAIRAAPASAFPHLWGKEPQ